MLRGNSACGLENSPNAELVTLVVMPVSQWRLAILNADARNSSVFRSPPSPITLLRATFSFNCHGFRSPGTMAPAVPKTPFAG